MLRQMGAPPGLINVMEAFYDQALRLFRVGAHAGDRFHPDNGLGQGCALSMRWTNCVGAVWVRTVKNIWADMRLSVYVDDRTIRGRTVGEVIGAIEHTVTFDGHLGQRLNVDKSSILATTSKQRKEASTAKVDGLRVLHAWDARSLGAHTKTVRRQSNGLGKKRLDGAVDSAVRISKTFVNKKSKRRMLEVVAAAKATHGAAITRLPVATAKDAAVTFMKVATGRGRKYAAPELVNTIVL